MKFLCIAVCVIAAVSANSVDEEATVLRSSFDQTPDKGFQYTFETSNGILGQASGSLKQLDKDEIALQVSGSSQYQSPEGELIQLTYVADENGYQPQGSHLPTTPAPLPIPDYIVRGLEYIKNHPYEEKTL